jgi:hypothetical protein
MQAKRNNKGSQDPNWKQNATCKRCYKKGHFAKEYKAPAPKSPPQAQGGQQTPQPSAITKGNPGHGNANGSSYMLYRSNKTNFSAKRDPRVQQAFIQVPVEDSKDENSENSDKDQGKDSCNPRDPDPDNGSTGGNTL